MYLITNEGSMCELKKHKTSLKPNIGCMLSSKLSDNSWINFYLNLIKLFYS